MIYRLPYTRQHTRQLRHMIDTDQPEIRLPVQLILQHAADDENWAMKYTQTKRLRVSRRPTQRHGATQRCLTRGCKRSRSGLGAIHKTRRRLARHQIIPRAPQYLSTKQIRKLVMRGQLNQTKNGRTADAFALKHITYRNAQGESKVYVKRISKNVSQQSQNKFRNSSAAYWALAVKTVAHHWKQLHPGHKFHMKQHISTIRRLWWRKLPKLLQDKVNFPLHTDIDADADADSLVQSDEDRTLDEYWQAFWVESTHFD